MWHTLFVMTGMESQVVKFLNHRIRHSNYDVHHRIFHPTRKLVHLKRGVKTVVSRPLFPGYLFVETEDIAYFKHELRECSNHLTVLKNIDNSLETVRKDEIDEILVLLSELGEIEFSTGLVESDRVRIVSGPLMNYCGEIIKISKRECKAKIRVNFLDKQSTIYVGLNVLEKVADMDLLNARDFHFAK